MLSQRVAEQLAELGIDPGTTAPDPEVTPESSDISWSRQLAYLSVALDPTEESALVTLIRPDAAELAAKLNGSLSVGEITDRAATYLDSIVNAKWPRQEEP